MGKHSLNNGKDIWRDTQDIVRSASKYVIRISQDKRLASIKSEFVVQCVR